MPDNMFYSEKLVLSRKTNDEVNSFLITRREGKGIMDYLQLEAFKDENEGIMRTYLVRDTDSDELVGYYSVRVGSVNLEFSNDDHGIYPGLELAYFGIDENYLSTHPNRKGCGLIIFYDLILPLAEKIKQYAALKGIYGYAVNGTTLMDRYINVYGFNRLSPDNEQRLHKLYRPKADKDCIFIYRDI